MSRVLVLAGLFSLLVAGAGACSDKAPPKAVKARWAPRAAVAPPAPKPAAPTQTPAPTLQQVNAAVFAPEPLPAPGIPPSPRLIRAQVLLARARFSPGVIDGRDGDNFRRALAAFETAHALPATTALTEASWQALVEHDPGPALRVYTVTAADLAGPFVKALPQSLVDLARLKSPGYSGPAEALAERFHMDEALLRALNPNVDFKRAGVKLVVADPGAADLGAKVGWIEVDKAAHAVRAYAEDGRVLAIYPATVGSTSRPSPTGLMTVNGVARNPVYRYDPGRLSFGGVKKKLTIAPGPNNPVGSVWIDLSRETYGIHGTPDPNHVGKTASHGCVRLTNWDVAQLASGVKPGARVVFVGTGQAAAAKSGPGAGGKGR